MAIVQISPALFTEIKQRFKGEAGRVIDCLKLLRKILKKGIPLVISGTSRYVS